MKRTIIAAIILLSSVAAQAGVDSKRFAVDTKPLHGGKSGTKVTTSKQFIDGFLYNCVAIHNGNKTGNDVCTGSNGTVVTSRMVNGVIVSIEVMMPDGQVVRVK